MLFSHAFASTTSSSIHDLVSTNLATVGRNGSTVRHFASDEKMPCSNLLLGILPSSAHACTCVLIWLISPDDETSLVNLPCVNERDTAIAIGCTKPVFRFYLFTRFYSVSIREYTRVGNRHTSVDFLKSRGSTRCFFA